MAALIVFHLQCYCHHPSISRVLHSSSREVFLHGERRSNQRGSSFGFRQGGSSSRPNNLQELGQVCSWQSCCGREQGDINPQCWVKVFIKKQISCMCLIYRCCLSLIWSTGSHVLPQRGATWRRPCCSTWMSSIHANVLHVPTTPGRFYLARSVNAFARLAPLEQTVKNELLTTLQVLQ